MKVLFERTSEKRVDEDDQILSGQSFAIMGKEPQKGQVTKIKTE